MVLWFGPIGFTEACDPDECAPVPVGKKCARCGEPIEPDDAGYLVPYVSLAGAEIRPWHRYCYLRNLRGSLAHVKGLCSCFGGSDHAVDAEAAGLTPRQEAAQAAKLWLRQMGGAPWPTSR